MDQNVVKKSKIIVDNLYGVLEFDPTIIKIVNHPIFQRMRNIVQLGSVQYVYPTAIHSRFNHSLGAYHVASKFIDHLNKDSYQFSGTEKLSKLDILEIQIAALTHDLGHGPFSHLMESVMRRESEFKDYHHEDISIILLNRIIDDNNIDLEPESIKNIEYMIQGKKNKEETSPKFQIVSSEMDCDRFDYLHRDSASIGQDCFKPDRIISISKIVKDRIAFRDTDIFNVKEVFECRKKLWRSVYCQKNVISIDELVKDILKDMNEREGLFNEIANPFFDLSSKNLKHSLTSYKKFDPNSLLTDIDILSRMKNAHKNTITNSLYNRLMTRNVLKNIYKCIFYQEISRDSFLKFSSETQSLDDEHASIEFEKKIYSYFIQDGIAVDKIKISIRRIDCGKKNKNPLENIPFFSKKNETEYYYLDNMKINDLGLNLHITSFIICLLSIDRDFHFIEKCYKTCERIRF